MVFVHLYGSSVLRAYAAVDETAEIGDGFSSSDYEVSTGNHCLSERTGGIFRIP